MPKKLSVIFLVVLLHLPTFASYMSPQLELRLQAGKSRHISRASLLLPCYSTDSSLLYANVIGMRDSNHALEGNFGFGYRHQVVDSIYGSFMHYDRRSHVNGGLYEQLTFGLEYFTNLLEVRANYYHAFNKVKSYQSKQPLNDGTSRYKLVKMQEFALSGLDGEVGVTLDRFSLYGGYYYYAKDNHTIHGPRFRTKVNLNDYGYLTGEVSYDNKRKLEYSIGIGVKVKFGKNQTLTTLQQKMLLSLIHI